MSYDSLSGKTDEYVKDRKANNEDIEAFSNEMEKLEDVMSDAADLDDDIQRGIRDIGHEFDTDREKLDDQQLELDERKKKLFDSINQELSKLNEANVKLEAVYGKKYADGAAKASDKCKDYIGQLEKMLDKIDYSDSGADGVISILDTPSWNEANTNVVNVDNILNARRLTTTQYGFTFQTVCGVSGSFYNDPNGTANKIIKKQGNNNYQMEGTCGLCQCANLLTMAGISGYNENRIIEAALQTSDAVRNSMEVDDPDPGNRGGTTVADRKEILGRCGLDTYIMPISFMKSKTMGQLNEAIRTGHGVIVSVDAARLWHNGQRGGHAISLISVSDDGRTYIYSDTGMGGIYSISTDDLWKSFTGRPANVTTNIIR